MPDHGGVGSTRCQVKSEASAGFVSPANAANPLQVSPVVNYSPTLLMYSVRYRT
jgi:hypothetical protein